MLRCVGTTKFGRCASRSILAAGLVMTLMGNGDVASTANHSISLAPRPLVRHVSLPSTPKHLKPIPAELAAHMMAAGATARDQIYIRVWRRRTMDAACRSRFCDDERRSGERIEPSPDLKTASTTRSRCRVQPTISTRRSTWQMSQMPEKSASYRRPTRHQTFNRTRTIANHTTCQSLSLGL